MAARILQEFPGYTLGNLMNEPVHVFYTLNNFVSRIRADHALEMQVPAIQAAMNGGDAFKFLEKRRGEYTIVDHSKEYTQSEYQAALEKAKSIVLSKNKDFRSIKLRDLNV